MSIKKINEKIAENVRKLAELELEKQKHERADKEVIELDERRAEVKLQAQIDHDNYLKERQRQQALRNEAKTPEARTRESFRFAREIRDKEISEGLTREQRAYKHMSEKDRRNCDNMIAEGEVRDIHGFLKKKRQKQEASDRRRKYLKGL